jgi:hypothetical protein
MNAKKIARNLYLLLLFSFFQFSGYKPGVRVIFRNDSKEDFKELQVNIIGQKFTFENLKAGEKTKPIKVLKSYRYCYAKAVTQNDTMICQPTDYVGEKLYTNGKLIMKLTIFSRKGEKRYLRINEPGQK